MANEPVLTIVGNLTADPELRFTPSGAAVANFTIASTPRTFNKQTNEWDDGEALFLNCSAWRTTGENIAESLERGTKVIAQGYLKARSYDTKDGDHRTVMELEVTEIGPSLQFATAKVTKTSRSNGDGGGQFKGQQNQGQRPQTQRPQQAQRKPAPAAADPWSQPANSPAPW